MESAEKHRQHLMEKLNIHEIAGLTAAPSRLESSKAASKKPLPADIFRDKRPYGVYTPFLI